MLTADSDTALVGALATALVACTIIGPTTVLGIRTVATAVVILRGIRTNRWGS